jgi:hypothetical protein
MGGVGISGVASNTPTDFDLPSLRVKPDGEANRSPPRVLIPRYYSYIEKELLILKSEAL